MTRLTADAMRKMAKEAQETQAALEKEKALELKAAAEENSRRAHLWQVLYSQAVQGETIAEIENLSIKDIGYLTELGFLVEEVYKREYDENFYKEKIESTEADIDKLQKELSELELALDKYFDGQYGINTKELKKWLKRNTHIAYSCNMEDWFGRDLDEVVATTQRDIDDLIAHAEEEILRTQDDERLRSLELLIAAASAVEFSPCPVSDPRDTEIRIDELRSILEEKRNYISFLEDLDDYIHPNEVLQIHSISWKKIIGNSEKSGIEGFDQESLCWLSSELGQNTIKSIEGAIEEAARRGDRLLSLEWQSDGEGFMVFSATKALRAVFPSLFTFKTSLEILSYTIKTKNSRSEQTVTIKW